MSALAKIDTHGNFPPGTFGHPRPQLERAWFSLNGLWDWAKDAAAQWHKPSQVEWDKRIIVPYAPETPASGVNETGFFKAGWYRRTFTRPHLKRGERLVLHFGAVDYNASVWVNGKLAVTHEGGYTPFSADITDLLNRKSQQTIIVRAEDDPHDMEKPRGKQDWQEQPHAIWYPRTSGIWQTVWLEVLPAVNIASLRWTANVAQWSIGLSAAISGSGPDSHSLTVTLKRGDEVLSRDSYSVSAGRVSRTINLPDPGIGDERNRLLWHPDSPTLIDATIELKDARGKVIDRVTSYTAMRTPWTQMERFMLNNDVCRFRMALDQGYWLETGLTAPDDAALKRDVELAKQMGLNGVRKHQKIEDPRFLYWADKLGLLVWEEMPSAYAFSNIAMQRLTREWLAVLERDCSHPCIVAWVPFNESWGLPDLPLSLEQRTYVRAIYQLTKAMDPTRPVVTNSGWEAVDGDMFTIHDYDSNPASFSARYEPSDDNFKALFKRVRPGGKILLLDGSFENKPIVIDEFGGIKYVPNSKPGDGSWGYSVAYSPEELAQKYGRLVQIIRHHPRLSGFCWTQLTDTYQEANGLLFMDRTPKVDLEQLRKINNGELTIE